MARPSVIPGIKARLEEWLDHREAVYAAKALDYDEVTMLSGRGGLGFNPPATRRARGSGQSTEVVQNLHELLLDTTRRSVFADEREVVFCGQIRGAMLPSIE